MQPGRSPCPALIVLAGPSPSLMLACVSLPVIRLSNYTDHHSKISMRSPILEDLDIAEAAKALWEAPFAVLSHDKFESEDPKFTYANKVCLLYWQFS